MKFMRRLLALTLLLCLAFPCAMAEEWAEWFTGETGGVTYTLTGVPFYLRDADFDGYWTNSEQLNCACLYDGAELTLRTGDVGVAVDRIAAERPDKPMDEVRLEAAMEFADFYITYVYGGTIKLTSTQVDEDGVLTAAFDYRYPRDPRTYQGKAIMIGNHVTVLMGYMCEHNAAALERMCVTPEGKEEAPAVTVQLGSLSVTYGSVPVLLSEELQVYCSLEEGFTLTDVQYIGPLRSPVNGANYTGSAAKEFLESHVLPIISGNAVYDMTVEDREDGSHVISCKTYSSNIVGKEDAEAYGQRFICVVIMRGCEVWYVLASDTPEGAAFIDLLVLAPEVE